MARSNHVRLPDRTSAAALGPGITVIFTSDGAGSGRSPIYQARTNLFISRVRVAGVGVTVAVSWQLESDGETVIYGSETTSTGSITFDSYAASFTMDQGTGFRINVLSGSYDQMTWHLDAGGT